MFQCRFWKSTRICTLKSRILFFAFDADLIPEEDINKSLLEVAGKINKGGCDFFENFFNGMVGRVKDHKNEISEKILKGKVFTEILSFFGDGADVHNDGKTSVVVTTDAGKFLYKPHDCKTDLVFKTICDKHFNDIVRVPEVLYAGEDYSFIEYITNNVASTENEAALFY